MVQTRKSSEYLLQQLIPVLKSRCNVKILDGYVEDLAGLFNRSRIYLYDSAEYWATNGVTEALACGCHLFSSVNHGLADYLDPGFNCHKIAGYCLEYDVQRIMKVLQNSKKPELSEAFWAEYRSERAIERLKTILLEINAFFDLRSHQSSNIQGLNFWRVKRLWFKRSLTKLQQRLGIGNR